MGSPDTEIDALLEEQNHLTNLYVTSDALARAASADAALAIAVEVLHNLAGVHRYAIWLGASAAGVPLALVAPTETRFRTGELADLRDDALRTGRVARQPTTPAGGAPLAMPLTFTGKTVGAIVVAELLPQLGGQLGKIHEELLALLGERLAPAMCDAALRSRKSGDEDEWAKVAASLVDLAER